MRFVNRGGGCSTWGRNAHLVDEPVKASPGSELSGVGLFQQREASFMLRGGGQVRAGEQRGTHDAGVVS
jgi:hypothetical protein